MDLLLNLMSTFIVTFWSVMWLMHLCAMYQARRKLKNQNHTRSAGGCIVDSRRVSSKQSSRPLHLMLPSAANCPAKAPQDLSKQPPSHLLNGTTTTTNNNILNCTNTKFNGNDKLLHYYPHQTTANPHRVGTYDCAPLPGVSIIKPLLGVDRNLRSNLETFFNMDYPLYEVLFCVQDKDDEAIPLVEELLKQYPEHDIKLFIGNGTRVGVNPKINNMQPAYEACKYELLLISDSGISMKPDTLLDMVHHMREDVALVQQMPFVLTGRTGFPSIVERVYFGTAHARAYLTADLLSVNCPAGMSALMRKCLLDEVGGIKAFGQYLAEDFFFAKSFTDRGWKISISSQPAMQNSANFGDTISTLNSRMQRWIKLRFAMIPLWTLLEPVSECMLLGVLSSMSMSYLWLINPYIVFVGHVIVWMLFDYKLLCLVQNGPIPCSKLEFVVAWLLRECTALVIYSMALARPQVTWRSRTFRLRWGGYAEEIGQEITTQSSVDVEKCTAEPCPVSFTSHDKLNDEVRVEKNTAPDEQHQQPVLRLLDPEPAKEIVQHSSWATRISALLDAGVAPAALEKQQQLDSRAAQTYDKNMRIECSDFNTTMGPDRHHLLDMAILAQA